MRTSIRLMSVALALATGLVLVPAGQAGELSRAAMLSASCEGCHGTYGRSPGTIPSIAGKSAEYLIETLEGFRSAEANTDATVMGRHVKGYTEEEVRRGSGRLREIAASICRCRPAFSRFQLAPTLSLLA